MDWCSVNKLCFIIWKQVFLLKKENELYDCLKEINATEARNSDKPTASQQMAFICQSYHVAWSLRDLRMPERPPES